MKIEVASQNGFGVGGTVLAKRGCSFDETRVAHRVLDVLGEGFVCTVSICHRREKVCKRQPRVAEIGLDGYGAAQRLYRRLIGTGFPQRKAQMQMRQRRIRPAVAQRL